MPELMERRKVEHSPTLNTVFMVEETLKNMDESVITMKGITWIHNQNPNIRKAISKGLEL